MVLFVPLVISNVDVMASVSTLLSPLMSEQCDVSDTFVSALS